MTLLARIVAQTSARRELLQALLGWVATVRRESGVVAASVAEDVEAPVVFHLTAAWGSTAAFEAHVRSDAFGILLGAFGVLAESVRISVDRSADEYGRDALPAIRRLRDTGESRRRAETEEMK